MAERVYYPLTSPQLSIWYIDKMYPGTSISNVAGTLRIKENVDFIALEQAINYFIKSNDAMRLHISLDENGSPQQHISEYRYSPIEFKDFSRYDDPVKSMFDWDNQETQRPFGLLGQDLFRFVMIKLDENDNGFYINTHHIISDAWTMGLLGSSIVSLYNEIIEAGTIIDKFPPSYITFIEDEQNYYKSNRFINDRTFWEAMYSSQPEVTILKPYIFSDRSTKSKRKTFVAPKKFTNVVRNYCAENKISPYPLFLSALIMYINRVCSKEDIIIGTPILNRLNRNEKNTTGMFISTIPLRIKMNSQDSFAHFSKDILDLLSLSFKHQRYPYEDILKYVREKHEFTGNLFDIVLSYQNSKFEKDHHLDFSTRWHFCGHQSNSLTIHINDRDDEGVLIIDYDYHSDQYYEKEIEFLHQHMLSLLWHALDNPEKEICKIEMLPESEKRRILYDFNNTKKEYPKEKTIHQLFEEQVEKYPDNIAVLFSGKSITYKVLNEKANSLARILRENGVSTDSIVGVLTYRSIEMVIAILAVLKAGGAYLYIDPELPHNRIELMLLECSVKIVLSEKKLSNHCTNFQFIDLSDSELYSYANNDVNTESNSNNLAYVIFTSGSTGKPKAVMVEHRSLNNFLHSVNSIIGFNSQMTVISISTASFDIFVFELFSTLLNGAKFVLTSDVERTNAEKLSVIFDLYKVDIIHGTPSVINMLLEYNKDIFKSIRKFIIGGEQFPVQLLNRLRANTSARIFNGYGPTECTIGVTFKELTDSSTVNIGKPINNTNVYILDDKLNLVPIGIPGEIYISGDNVSRGYFNNQEKTKEKFISCPFNNEITMYKTGDWAKWFTKGEIEFLGRVDNQIKINGYRIELEEIRNHILNISEMNDAVVVVRESNNKQTLCAYLVSSNSTKPELVHNYLSKVLPNHMIPSFITFIPSIPLTPNGKINIKKLPEPISDNYRSIYVLPNNEIEKEVHEIWRNVLNLNHISVNDNIHNIGGDSIDIITITSMIYKKLKVDLPISEMKNMDTIRKTAQYIKERNQVPNMKHNQICLLREGKKNIFFIHAGNGEINNYIDLSRFIDSRYGSWGIKMDFNGCAPYNISINEIAQQYVQFIKTIQPNGPYYLAGWCIGGTIAYEMANIIEREHEKVGFLGLFNSIAPQEWDGITEFSSSAELMFIRDETGIDLKPLVDKMASVEEIWASLISYINDKSLVNEFKARIPEDMRRSIPRFDSSSIEDIIRYMNGIRVLHNARAFYHPKNKLITDLYFFNALNDTIIKNKDDNIEKWNQYCLNKIHNVNIDADHYSAFNFPYVETLGQLINGILIENEGQEELYV